MNQLNKKNSFMGLHIAGAGHKVDGTHFSFKHRLIKLSLLLLVNWLHRCRYGVCVLVKELQTFLLSLWSGSTRRSGTSWTTGSSWSTCESLHACLSLFPVQPSSLSWVSSLPQMSQSAHIKVLSLSASFFFFTVISLQHYWQFIWISEVALTYIPS